MKKIVLILISLLLSSEIFATEYAIITSTKMPKLSPSQIKALFLKKRSFVDGMKIVPVNLSVRSSTRRSFEAHILNMHMARLKSYWAKQHYLGVRPPITLKSQESVKRFVQKVKGSIAYIELTADTKNIIILYKWSE